MKQRNQAKLKLILDQIRIDFKTPLWYNPGMNDTTRIRLLAREIAWFHTGYKDSWRYYRGVAERMLSRIGVVKGYKGFTRSKA